MFETIAEEQLTRPCGGITMRLTQYGYRNDPYSDSETRKGHGAYRNLERGNSIALMDSALHALGLTKSYVRHHPTWVQLRMRGGGMELRRIDDRVPNGDGHGHLYGQHRADLYQPGGINRHLPDYADVSLVPRAIPVHR